jgi:hypothetical protein
MHIFDLQPVLDFSRSLPSYTTATNAQHDLFATPCTPPPQDGHGPAAQSSAKPSLGDFTRVFEGLGLAVPSVTAPFPIPSPTPRRDFPDESASDAEECSTAASSPPEDTDVPVGTWMKKGVQWDDLDDTKKPTVQSPTQRAKIIKDLRQEKVKTRRQQARLRPATDALESRLESEIKGSSRLTALPADHDHLTNYSVIAPSPTQPLHLDSQPRYALTPAWVKPVLFTSKISYTPLPPPPLPSIPLDPQIIRPFSTLTLAEKKERLVKKLIRDYTMDSRAFHGQDRARALTQPRSDPLDHGVHIFVDASNIWIGFQNALKNARDIHKSAYVRRAPLSFHNLALILERGRPIARRVLAGSTAAEGDVPDYIKEAERCGYEINILERVRKIRTPKQPRYGSGYWTSGHSSGSEAPMSGTYTMGEQGVDEILHLKMLESIVDGMRKPSTTPRTMVLATGDAAVAEYSGGFMEQVERALSLGWNVEVVAWGDGLSYAYKNKEFQKRWKGRFSVMSLDAFSEELLAVYVGERS